MQVLLERTTMARFQIPSGAVAFPRQRSGMGDKFSMRFFWGLKWAKAKSPKIFFINQLLKVEEKVIACGKKMQKCTNRDKNTPSKTSQKRKIGLRLLRVIVRALCRLGA